MATQVDFDHVPVARAPQPITAPLCSPEVNFQLNVTPEKKGSYEVNTRREIRRESRNSNAEHNFLSIPAINSTTHVTQKLKKLSQSTFDTSLVVKEELQKSEQRRLDIAEKASEALNYNLKDSKYTGLVSLDVSTSNLGVQQRKIFKEKKIIAKQEEPDIMTFMSDDFQYESVSLLCNCPSSDAEPDLFTPLTDNVFKLYEHMECWKR